MADNDVTQALMQRGLRKELMPQHVAFVIDGSRRWAQARGLTSKEGYKAGCLALEKIIELSGTLGIRAITVFGFSQENFRRPQDQVDSAMEMIEEEIRDNIELFAREGIRVYITGDPSRRPASLQEAILEVEEATRNNSRFHMILATCYSGRWDIVQACRELASKVQDKVLNPEDIDEAMLTDHLSTNVLGELACPDLLIRTSGELRLSNFLLWQSAYSELYFSNALWPDFDEDEYIQALKEFQRRDRRFGQRKASQPSN